MSYKELLVRESNLLEESIRTKVLQSSNGSHNQVAYEIDVFSWKYLKSKKGKSQLTVEKMVDAPYILKIFGYDLLDCTSYNGGSKKAAIALENEVYSWMMEESGNTATARLSQFSSHSDSKTLAIASSNGSLNLLDLETNRNISTFSSRSNIFSLSFNQNLLTSGHSDGFICHYDVRTNRPVKEIQAHENGTLGVEWNVDGLSYASTGSDGIVKIWHIRDSTPELRFEGHKKQVKALSWNLMNHNLLCTGGLDGDLHLWNKKEGCLVKTIYTNSTINALSWSSSVFQVATCHGDSQDKSLRNSLAVWDFNTKMKIDSNNNHQDEVMYMASVPGTGSILTVGKDETLIKWKVWGNSSEQISAKTPSLGSDIR